MSNTNELTRSELKEAIQAKVVECVKLGMSKLNLTGRDIDLNFDKKGTTAGTASWYRDGSYSLDFNLELAMLNQQETLNQTVPHEVSHILDYWMHPGGMGSSHHGDNWKYIMAFVYGLRPDRCHSMDVSSVKRVEPRIHKLGCSSCGKNYWITTRQHNKSIWSCKCGKQLVYLGIDLLGAK